MTCTIFTFDPKGSNRSVLTKIKLDNQNEETNHKNKQKCIQVKGLHPVWSVCVFVHVLICPCVCAGVFVCVCLCVCLYVCVCREGEGTVVCYPGRGWTSHMCEVEVWCRAWASCWASPSSADERIRWASSDIFWLNSRLLLFTVWGKGVGKGNWGNTETKIK